jgi:hypothetical protein
MKSRIFYLTLAVVILFVAILVVNVILGVAYAKAFPTRKCWNGIFNREHDELLRMMDCIDQTFHRYRILYWIHCGTLIGAVRHGKLIEWDDDMDLVVVVPKEPLQAEMFYENWTKACAELESESILTKGMLPSLVHITQFTSGAFAQDQGLHIDVMFYHTALRGDKLIYEYKSRFLRSITNEWWFATEATPTKRYVLHDSHGKPHYCDGPNKPWPFLSRAYPLCHLKARMQVPHRHCSVPSHSLWANIATLLVGDYPLTEEERQRARSFMQQAATSDEMTPTTKLPSSSVPHLHEHILDPKFDHVNSHGDPPLTRKLL